MQFKSAALDQIAQFICGDNPLPFPYRSSSRLTSFFTGLGLDYIHHGETRNPWVRDAITDINRKAPSEGLLPSAEMTSVIEEVMNPTYFEASVSVPSVDYDAALKRMNSVLRQYKLEVVLDQSIGVASLRTVDGLFVSTAHQARDVVTKITFAPKVFEIPHSTEVQRGLVAIMMPFDPGFSGIHDAIQNACSLTGLRCRRADDIWANSTIIQDIVDLIFAAEIVVVDFTGKNPNVMYETGIAHTLGKHVVPITQSIEHVPFDLKPHRVLPYHPNREGLAKLTDELALRLKTITQGHSW
ncbi:hypothetical protein [Planctellipticum variicoloris]|uniref:hypothetical protein n=1 Tax=Planctellipticum variicoloris TaxID=3064265 RepID=UPI0030131FBE|nr:hypothetical protein SH412_002385 [Planctomycetaceae bacterium SH412]